MNIKSFTSRIDHAVYGKSKKDAVKSDDQEISSQGASDEVSISGSSGDVIGSIRKDISAKIDKAQKMISEKTGFKVSGKLINDVVLHLGLGDSPMIIALAANMCSLPGILAPAIAVCNVVNAVNTIPSLAADLKQVKDVFKDPDASKKDKAVELGHLVTADVIPMVGSALPIVFLGNPAAIGLFAGSQILGLGSDIYKTAYDIEHEKAKNNKNK